MKKYFFLLVYKTRAGFTPIKSGFTLIELLLYMSLLSVFLLITSTVFVQALDVQVESEAVTSIEQDGRYILSKISYDIARASSITNPSGPGSTSAQLQFIASNLSHSYMLNGENLIYGYGTNSAQLNGYGTSISNLLFSRKGNTASSAAAMTMSVSFTVTSKFIRAKGADTKVFSATFGTR